MERFRLRVRHEPKRGNVWELQVLPDQPARLRRPAPARTLGAASAPELIDWLREVARPILRRHDPPVSVETFGPTAEPVILEPGDGMRLALAFSAARYLATPRQRQMFRDGLAELPDEVLLYWFTLCFYGHRTAAGRAALRTLLTHEEPVEWSPIAPRSPFGSQRSKSVPAGADLFSAMKLESSTALTNIGQGHERCRQANDQEAIVSRAQPEGDDRA